MRENPKTFQTAVQSALAEHNLRIRFQLRTNDTHSGSTRDKEPMEIYHIRPQKKCFLCKKVGHLDKPCRSRSVNIVEQVQNAEVKDRNCCRCGQACHFKRNCPKLMKHQILHNSKQGSNQGN